MRRDDKDGENGGVDISDQIMLKSNGFSHDSNPLRSPAGCKAQYCIDKAQEVSLLFQSHIKYYDPLPHNIYKNKSAEPIVAWIRSYGTFGCLLTIPMPRSITPPQPFTAAAS